MLDYARKTKVDRFIQISTDEVYGSIESGSFTENSPIESNSPYAASKAAADLLIRSYIKTYDFPAIITRSANNYGPRQYPEKLIPLMITNAFYNNLLPVYGDGMNVRDWLYVLDNCRAIDLVLHQGKIGEIYNIGAGNEKTNIEVVKMILKIMSKKESLIKYVSDRPAHDQRYSVDSSKIRKLGWKPGWDFEKGLRCTIEWYVKKLEKEKR